MIAPAPRCERPDGDLPARPSGRLCRLAARLVAGLALATGAVAAGAAADFVDQRRLVPVHGDAAAGVAKAQTCLGCHGAQGIAIVPTFPNLAGQKIDYLAQRLRVFRAGLEPESPMTALSAALSDTDIADIAAHFAALPLPPGASGDDDAARVFRSGDPARGIAPCQGCHGRDADGHPALAAGATNTAWLAYPALRGQHAGYVAQRLRDFRAGKSGATSNTMIMRGVAHDLDDASIDAIAAWLAATP